MIDLKEDLINYLSELNINYTAEDIEKVLKFLSIVFNYNQTKNIIGTKELENIFYRHFLDCLSIFSIKDYFSQKLLCGKYVLDLGSGAGLPGILIAIFIKDANIVLIEKNNKKAEFLKFAAEELGLKNVYAVNKPAEEIGRENRYREKFDFCIARAVAKIEILSELIIPFCKINGKIFLYKSSKALEETSKIRSFSKKLGIFKQEIFETEVPRLDEYRAFIVMEKNKVTPLSFPRNYAVIKRESLFCKKES